jgi:creatinine amidohydrolase
VIRLAERTFREAAALARDERSVVLLPLGAVEQHGPHLPLLVDWLGAEELARRIAPHLGRAGYRPVLAPSLPYGVSTLAVSWAGTMSLSPAVFRRIVRELVGGLARHGFRRFVLTNYQADPDHLAALGAVTRQLRRAGLLVLVGGFTPDARGVTPMTSPRVIRLLRSPQPRLEWHSGELETAFMLATRPALVREAVARRLPAAWVDFRGALAGGARRFEHIHPDGQGYFGWPAAARAVTGRRVLALRARLIARELVAELRRWRPPGRPRACRAPDRRVQ